MFFFRNKDVDRFKWYQPRTKKITSQTSAIRVFAMKALRGTEFRSG